MDFNESGGADRVDTTVSAGYNETTDPNFRMSVLVNKEAEVAILHNKPFTDDLSWVEYDLNDDRLVFVLADGEVRDFGGKMQGNLKPVMQNVQRVLVLLMDESTGDAVSGDYYPLILNQI